MGASPAIISRNGSKLKLSHVNKVAGLEGQKQLADDVRKRGYGWTVDIERHGRADGALHYEQGTGPAPQVEEVALLKDFGEFVPGVAGGVVP
jgi:hypothetical protein